MDDPMLDAGWDCPQCTLINPVGTLSCNVCGWSMDAGSKTLRLDGASSEDLERSLRAAVSQIWGEPTISTLLKLVGNAADQPHDPKFRGPVRKANKSIRSTIVDVAGAAEVLRRAGFEEDEECFLLRDPDVGRLSLARRLLEDQERAITCRKLVPVKRRTPKFDEDLLREVQAEVRYKECRWGKAAPDAAMRPEPPPASSSSSSPVPMAVDAAGGPMRVRVRLPMGASMDLEVEPSTSAAAFGLLLQERTGVPVRHQRVRFGYPPRQLRCDGAVTLLEAGLHKGEVVVLENLRDLFLGNLESGAFTMRELQERLPAWEEAGVGSTGNLFAEALAAFNIDPEERNFWAAVRHRMQLLDEGSGHRVTELEAAQVRSGLFILQRLFHNHDPRERLALVLDCLPGYSGPFRSMHRAGHTNLVVDRANFLGSIAHQVLGLTRDQLLMPVHVKFTGEPGVDAGGLMRDFFSNFANRVGEDEPSLWELTGRGSLRPVAEVVATAGRHPCGLYAKDMYRACGRVFGMAVLHGCKLGRPLAHHFARVLIGDPPQTLPDLQSELRREASTDEPDFRGNQDMLLQSLEECGLSGMLTFTRAVKGHRFLGECELVRGGAKIVVTDANKADWLARVLHNELVESVSHAARPFRQGLSDVFGGSGEACPLLCLLDADDLIELWGRGGVSRSEVGRWRAVARVSPVVQRQADWLWQVLQEDYDDELRGKVLQFATGSSSLGRDGLQGFAIEPADGGDERLPNAMTCGNMLQLPRYSCRAVLSERLRTAAEDCSSFQFA